MSTSSDLINLLEWLTELKHRILLGYHLLEKNINQEQADGGDTLGRVSMLSSGTQFSLHLQIFTNLEVL